MKFYFWLLCVAVGFNWGSDILVLTGVLEGDTRKFHSVYYYFDTYLLSVICILGLYAYVYGKKIGPKLFWKIFSVFYLVLYVGSGLLWAYQNIEKDLIGTLFVVGFGIIIAIPLFIGLFKYAFKAPKENEI